MKNKLYLKFISVQEGVEKSITAYGDENALVSLIDAVNQMYLITYCNLSDKDKSDEKF